MEKETKPTQTSGIIRLQRINNVKKEYARELRKNQTPAEELLWSKLRNRQVAGLKFRRQQVIEGFIADFYCEELRLVVEVDGSVHDSKEQKEIDEYRRKVFELKKFWEIRFGNDQIMQNINEVLKQIETYKQR